MEEAALADLGFLPGEPVAEHGVEDADEAAFAGDHRDLVRFPCRAQPRVVVAQRWLPPDGARHRFVERVPHQPPPPCPSRRPTPASPPPRSSPSTVRCRAPNRAAPPAPASRDRSPPRSGAT